MEDAWSLVWLERLWADEDDEWSLEWAEDTSIEEDCDCVVKLLACEVDGILEETAKEEDDEPGSIVVLLTEFDLSLLLVRSAWALLVGELDTTLLAAEVGLLLELAEEMALLLTVLEDG